MTPSFDPSPLIPYVEGLGLKYHYIRDDSKCSDIFNAAVTPFVFNLIFFSC
jgi:hypothetical protein